MSKINCETTTDLLPLYVENLASESSNELVREHLEECTDCRQREQDMRTAVTLPKNTDAAPLRAANRLLIKKRVTAALLALCCVFLPLIFTFVHLNSPIIASYDEVSDIIRIEERDGVPVLIIENSSNEMEVSLSQASEPDSGLQEVHVNLNSTLMKHFLFERIEDTAPSDGVSYSLTVEADTEAPDEEFVFTEEVFDEGSAAEPAYFSRAEIPLPGIDRIGYYPGNNGGETVYLYESEKAAAQGGGSIVLPRLTLNYYTIIAVVLAVICLPLCFLFRKNEKRFFTALKIALIPALYAVCSIITLMGKSDIYNAPYYFSGILAATVTACIAAWLAIDYIRCRRSLREQ